MCSQIVIVIYARTGIVAFYKKQPLSNKFKRKDWYHLSPKVDFYLMVTTVIWSNISWLVRGVS